MPANSTPESGFTPRKEFIRDQHAPPNSFSLLAVSGSSFIRLYSFPLPVVAALRRLFEQRSIIAAFRENTNQNLCEFSLQGKPWASPKCITTEKLLVDILAIIYQHGYTYLSAIDYGREHDDRLAMAFSKPSSIYTSTRTGSPRPSSHVPDGSHSSFSDKTPSKRIPFALSFPSATMLRVIAPPLHSTPAILQAVRGSWPRGVVSEKRIGDPYGSFEFKLKGYKWFQEDTFATDSLRHILSLLSSLDAHSFSLLTSISLTNRSRVKDLWVFTGPATTETEDLLLPDSPAPSILNASHGQIKRADPPIYNQPPVPQGSQSQHRRVATAPTASPSTPPQPSSHARSASDNSAPRKLAINPHTHQSPPIQGAAPPSPQSPSHYSRKPAPRAQVPISVVHEAEQEGQRTNLPSTISSSVENMTGVGATGYTPDVFYTSSPFGAVDSQGRSTPPLAPIPIPVTATRPRSVTPPSRGRSPLRPVSSRAKTPPLLTSNPSSSQSSPSHAPLSSPDRQIFPSHHIQGSPDRSSASGTPPLLGPGVFRDSAFSSTTTASCEIPIKWTGNNPEQGGRTRSKKPSFEERMSPGPVLPGGWQPTPVEEKIEEAGGAQEDETLELKLHQDKNPERPLQEVCSRVENPELMQPDVRLRKSETGLVGFAATSPPPPPPPVPIANKGKDKDAPSSGSGQGWVLVNIEGRKSPSLSEVPSSPVFKDGRNIESARPKSPRGPPGQQVSMSPAAKAIVIIDAVENNGVDGNPKSGEGTPSRMRKLFTLARKNSKKAQEQGGDDDGAKNKTRVKTQSGFREKIRRMGTAEAARNDEKRRSFD